MSGKFTDHKGRPVVVVTGMGTVTSLGRGKKDNWAALVAGKSGIHRIKRFPDRGIEYLDCRHGRFHGHRGSFRSGDFLRHG